MCTFSTSDIWTSKKAQNPKFFTLLTWKCASRHNVVHFFDISTSKSGPEPVCFVLWLGNVLRATTACTFSTAELPKVVRTWCVLHILTWKCALRHNGVQFFIAHLASWLRTRRFSEPTFRPSRATNHWKKTQWIVTFLPFRAPASSCFSLFLFSIFSLLGFSLSSLTLPTSAFPSLHIVGSLTSKLPSIIYIYIDIPYWYESARTGGARGVIIRMA